MKLVIIAGGKGTRLKDLARDIPKPLIPVAGKPILEHQILLAKRYGFRDIIILLGHLGDQIRTYFGNGSRWGVKIKYVQELQPLGTAGCVKDIETLLTKDFLVFYGDTIMDIDLAQFVKFHKKHKGTGTLLLHPNDHPQDSDLVDIDDSTGQITDLYSKDRPAGYYRNLVNAALYVLSPKIFKYIKLKEQADFARQIFPRALVGKEKLFGYLSAEYIKDMGTPERIKEVEHDLISGKVRESNLGNKRPAVFFDRDGVLSREVDLVHRNEDLHMLPNAPEAVRKINSSGYLAIVVTNQPVIARNLIDIPGLRQIHNKMETEFGEKRAYLDALYFCPHHPDKGFPEERKEYKIKCKCRKPEPGMLLSAAKKFNIDLKKSFIIGDRWVDIQAGKNAGVKTIAVKRNGEIPYNEQTKPDFMTDNVFEAVKLILGEK